MTQLYKFHGGVHPPTQKDQSNRTPIATPPLPSKLVIPFHQHVGGMAKPLVNAGDYVFKGQLIGMPEDGLSSAIHASTSGTIAEIGMQVVAHASGLPDLCAVLIPDGKEAWVEREQRDPLKVSAADVRQILRLSGVVGLGGAVFPSDGKLRGGKHHVRTIVLNGAECEPYITCDDMLMCERAKAIVHGGEIIRRTLGADEVIIGIEDNKPQAIAAMQEAAVDRSNMRVVAVPTLYPGGGAKQLIRVLTGIEVAAGVRSTDKGVQCFNVATAYCIYRAVAFSEPLLSRIVTVTGNVEKPQNFEVLIGTPVHELVAWAGRKDDTKHYIMGGPMMGVALPNDNVSVVKACNCIIAASDELFPPAPPAMPCIRCTRCAQACPQELQPQDLYWFAKSKNFGKAQEFHLFDCIECGACSYVCPSHIPLVQYYRFAKSEIWARDADKKAADRARERHEFREFRSEREKQEKAEKLAAKEKAALAAKQAAPAAADEAQRKIAAAVAAAQSPEAINGQQQAALADIAERRARLQERAQSDVAHKED